MGFYGNITNTSNTTFQFDRIYPNRLAMDANANNDGIFIGRYVLVEYERNAAYPVVYTKTVDSNLQFYSSPNCEDITRIKFGTGNDQINQNDIVKSYPQGTHETTTDGGEWPTNTDDIKFYRCTGEDTNHYAIFTKIINESELFEKSDYIINYGIDENHYKPTGENERRNYKGYDSTVWTKVSETSATGQLITKYVNIADLNSVVPTFDIAADAPTMEPITPHFDADSTNVYYKLHVQTPFGFRVKEESDENKSDVETTHYTTTYNKQNNTMNTGIGQSVNASIYYNQKGFDPNAKNSHVKDDNEQELPNYIKIEPTGKSSNYNNYSHQVSNYYKEIGKIKKEDWKQNTYYYLSNNEFKLSASWSNITYYVKEEIGDIQEFSLHLPAIGNMMSDAWDIIHGPLRNDDMRQYLTNEEGKMLDKDSNITEDESKAVKVDSLQGRLNSIAAINNNEIPVKRESDGRLVGTKINGDNNRLASEISNILEESLSTSFREDDAWIYTKIDSNAITDEHNNGIAIHHTFHARDNSPINKLNINDYNYKSGGSTADPDTGFQKIIDKNTIQLYVPKVDRAGHVVGSDIDKIVLPYGYKHIETIGNNIDNDATDLDTTQDTVSDDKETVTAGVPTGTTAIVANGTQDIVNIDPFNKWIQIKASDNKVEIAHEIHGIVTKEKETDLNTNGIDTITFHDLEFDAAGHVDKNQLHTYTLPYGFKTIKAAAQSTAVTDPSTNTTEVIADSTQDTLQFASSNKWIKMSGTNKGKNINYDTFNIGHEVHPIDEEKSDLGDIINNIKTSHTNLNSDDKGNETEKNLTIYDWKYDAAGHITEKRAHTYTLPYGYKQIVATNSTAVNVEPSIVTDKPTADNTQDILNIKAANKWIKLNTTDNSTDGNSISFAHTLVGTNFGNTYYSNVDNSNTSDDHNRKLDFGSSFKIFNLTTDNAGHITDINTNDITLPTIGLSTSGSGNVVTDISYSYNSTNKKGTFTETRSNVGSLVLTGYNGTSTGNVSNTDTINTAFAKVENKINTFLQDASVTEGAIDTLKELQDYISTHTSDAEDMVTAINNIYKEVEGIESGVLINKTDALADRIEKINGEVSANTGNYISSIKIEDDTLSVGTTALPRLSTGSANGTIKLSNGNDVKVKGLGNAAYKNEEYFAKAEQGSKADSAIQPETTFNYGEEQKTIQELMNIVNDLQKQINELKNPPQEPDEGGETV